MSDCHHCHAREVKFETKQPKQRFCSVACANAHYGGRCLLASEPAIGVQIRQLSPRAQNALGQRAVEEMGKRPPTGGKQPSFVGLLTVAGVIDRFMDVMELQTPTAAVRSELIGIVTQADPVAASKMVIQALMWDMVDTARLLIGLGIKSDLLVRMPIRGKRAKDTGIFVPESRADLADMTVLHYLAGDERYYDLLDEALLAKRVNVDVRDDRNATPLFDASINGHASLVRLLLAKGASAIHTDGLPILVSVLLGAERTYERAVAVLNEYASTRFDANVLFRLKSVSPIKRINLLYLALSTRYEPLIRALLSFPGLHTDTIDSEGTSPTEHPMFASVSQALRDLVTRTTALVLHPTHAPSYVERLWRDWIAAPAAIEAPPPARPARPVAPLQEAPPAQGLAENAAYFELQRIASRASAMHFGLRTRDSALVSRLIQEGDAAALNYSNTTSVFSDRGTVMQQLVVYNDMALITLAIETGGDALAVGADKLLPPTLIMACEQGRSRILAALLSHFNEQYGPARYNSKQRLAVYDQMLSACAHNYTEVMSVKMVFGYALGELASPDYTVVDAPSARQKLFTGLLQQSIENREMLELLLIELNAQVTQDFLLMAAQHASADVFMIVLKSSDKALVKSAVTPNTKQNLAHLIARRMRDLQHLGFIWNSVVDLLRTLGVAFSARDNDGFLPQDYAGGSAKRMFTSD